jgi:hypothetical protein
MLNIKIRNIENKFLIQKNLEFFKYGKCLSGQGQLSYNIRRTQTLGVVNSMKPKIWVRAQLFLILDSIVLRLIFYS